MSEAIIDTIRTSPVFTVERDEPSVFEFSFRMEIGAVPCNTYISSPLLGGDLALQGAKIEMKNLEGKSIDLPGWCGKNSDPELRAARLKDLIAGLGEVALMQKEVARETDESANEAAASSNRIGELAEEVAEMLVHHSHNDVSFAFELFGAFVGKTTEKITRKLENA